MASGITYTRSDPLLDSLQHLGQSLSGGTKDLAAQRLQDIQMQQAVTKTEGERSLAQIGLKEAEAKGEAGVLKAQGELAMQQGTIEHQRAMQGFEGRRVNVEEARRADEARLIQPRIDLLKTQTAQSAAEISRSNIETKLKGLQWQDAQQAHAWNSTPVSVSGFAAYARSELGPNSEQLITELFPPDAHVPRGQVTALVGQVKNWQGAKGEERIKNDLADAFQTLTTTPPGTPAFEQARGVYENGLRFMQMLKGHSPGRNPVANFADLPKDEQTSALAYFKVMDEKGFVLYGAGDPNDWFRARGILKREEGRDPMNTWMEFLSGSKTDAKTGQVTPRVPDPAPAEMTQYQREKGREITATEARTEKLRRMAEMSRQRYGTLEAMVSASQGATTPTTPQPPTSGPPPSASPAPSALTPENEALRTQQRERASSLAAVGRGQEQAQRIIALGQEFDQIMRGVGTGSALPPVLRDAYVQLRINGATQGKALMQLQNSQVPSRLAR